jgi:putative peptidoglycan lipid II flippase
MVVAGLGLLLAVRRHLGPDALSGVWRALLVLVAAAGVGAAAGWLVPAWLGSQKLFGWFVSGSRHEVEFDGGQFAVELGLGLAVGLLAACVTLVVAALLDRDLRAAVGPRLGGLRGKFSRKS